MFTKNNRQLQSTIKSGSINGNENTRTQVFLPINFSLAAEHFWLSPQLLSHFLR